MKIEQIIKDNEKMIYKLASRFYGVNKDDLFQAGVLGLLKALRNYDDRNLAKFSSYAYDYIFGEMYLLVNNRTIKTPRSVLKLFKTIEKTRSSLAQKIGKIPTNEEIATFLGVDISVVNESLIAGYEIMSLDNESQRSYYETIENKNDHDIDNDILISQSMEFLTNDEKNIIKARYYEDLTQMQTAKKLCMTQVMVSRYEKRGLNKMQAFIQK